MPLTTQARLLFLSRSVLGLSILLLVTRIVVFSTMSFWAQLPYDPAHPTPVGDRSITYHTTPFIGWCLNHAYLFFLFFFASLVLNTIVETKYRAARSGGPASPS